jgi:N-methylhydantoinase A
MVVLATGQKAAGDKHPEGGSGPVLGVDTGGTFTDFVLFDPATPPALRVHKVLSTPQAPEQAILQGIRELGLADCAELRVVHGSTVATNAVLEGKGVRTAFITNRGLRDMLTLGRQARRELYNLNPVPVAPPVPRELCLETGGRLGADGAVLEALTEAELAALRSQLQALAPRAVAINLLFSYLDDSLEKRIAAAVPAGLFVSRSSAILPEYREYERGITTWLNASVGPLVEGYLQRLCAGISVDIPTARVAVMQSAGGSIEAEQAGAEAVHMLLSGPAGGLAGVQWVGRQAGCERLLSFDMGGTSTDVALLDNAAAAGELPLTTEGRIGPYPVGVPMVDMHTIGAGGGSIARVDAGGLLQVGPQSAGADPGPACYGRGGREATVTDANVVLGRLRPQAFLGGGMGLDVAAAEAAVERVAQALGLSCAAAAQGIVDVANEHMARALRVMSVQRGVDPRQLTLACFGGAGGLHVCALAEALGMDRALVPMHGGVLSALGMLAAPRARFLSLTVNRLLQAVDDSALAAEFETLAEGGRQALLREGVAAASLEMRPTVDVRYRGQSYAINLPWQGAAATLAAFHARHQALYGHQLPQAVELVTLRVKVQSRAQPLALASSLEREGTGAAVETVRLAGIAQAVPVYARRDLIAPIDGPAVITETVATTYLASGWRCTPHGSGSLLLARVD